MKKLLLLLIFFTLANFSKAFYSHKTISLTDIHRLKLNSAGPMLILTNEYNDQVFVAHTLTSTISIIEGKSDNITNIPIASRALQHLRKESFTYNKNQNKLYLIGYKSLNIIDLISKKSDVIWTDVQFESLTVDDKSGNIFLTSRETGNIGFYNNYTKTFSTVKWLDIEQKIENLNQTPPPAIRKIIALNDIKQTIIAIDGFTSSLTLFYAEDAHIIKTRKIALQNPDGRWHLAGINKNLKKIYLVTESKQRKVLQAGAIDIFDENDEIINLPDGFTEPVGIIYNFIRNETYITYDNNPSLHIVDFNKNDIVEVALPSYGNDGIALDEMSNTLYIASWAFGEIEIIDLQSRRMIKNIRNLGIIPHMFTLAYNKFNKCLYYPIGASAVNGTFGAAVTKLDIKTEITKKIYTGWAPIDIIEIPERNSFFIFNNEDQFVEVKYGGSFKNYTLPFDFPVTICRSPENNIYLSYGPHQSYWPTVYIWGAKNGILTINTKTLEYYDRRIPRQAMQMVLDKEGELYLEQNNWGSEPIFINKILDEIRYNDINKRIILNDSVTRENTRTIMKYDSSKDWIYLINQAENDDLNSKLYIIDAKTDKEIKSIQVEKIPVALEFNNDYIYVANFSSNSVSMINKETFETFNIKVGKQPLRLLKFKDKIFVLNYASKDIMEVNLPQINRSEFGYKIPFEIKPDNFFIWGDEIIITGFDSNEIKVIAFNSQHKTFEEVLTKIYDYGQIDYDSGNASFYLKGVYGDLVQTITKGKVASNGDFWLVDFISGRLFIISKN